MGNDTAFDLNISLISTPIFASSTDGFVTVAGVSLSSSANPNETITASAAMSTTTQYIKIYLFSSDLNSSQAIQVVTIGGTVSKNSGYSLYNFWFQDNYFYLIYTITVSGFDNTVYHVGFHKDGTLSFTAPLKLNSVDLKGNANIKAGQSGNTAVVAWREDTQSQVVYVEVNLKRAIVKDEVVIATDTGAMKFIPSVLVFSSGYYVIVMSQTSDGLATGITVSCAGNSNNTALDFALTAGYSNLSVSAASAYYNGWFIIIRQTSEIVTAITASQETLELYNYTATAKDDNSTMGNEIVLLEDGSIIQSFTFPNQSEYILILDNVDGLHGTWTAGYIGQVFPQISHKTSGVALKLTFVTIASIFATLLTI